MARKSKNQSRAVCQAEPIAVADSKVAAVVAGMTPALRIEYEHLKSRLASADRSEVIDRHEIAVVVRKILDDGTKYGEGAVKQLEAALGIDDRTLYRRAHVAGIWPTVDAIERLLSLRNKFGRPLTWSHLEVLAEVADENDREALIDLTLAKGLSVRKLRALIAKRHAVWSDHRRTFSADPSHVLTAPIGDPTMQVECGARWPGGLDPFHDAPALPGVAQMLRNPPEGAGLAPSGAASTPRLRQHLEAVLAAVRVAHDKLREDLEPVISGLGAAETAIDLDHIEGPDMMLVDILKVVHRMGDELSEAGFAVQRFRMKFFRRVRTVPALPATGDVAGGDPTGSHGHNAEPA